MKIKYLIPIFLVIIIIIIVLILKNKKDNSITDFKSFRLFYTKGYAMNADISYELIDKDNKLIALIKPYGISDEDKLEIEVSSDVKKEVIEVLQKYQVHKWDGFHKSDKNVLDGDSFSISINLLDDKNISASGYMSWPTNYRSVVSEIDTIFMHLYDNNK